MTVFLNLSPVGSDCNELDGCGSTPCQNDGTCKDVEDDSGSLQYTCECTDDYAGMNCEVIMWQKKPISRIVQNIITNWKKRARSQVTTWWKARCVYISFNS